MKKRAQQNSYLLVFAADSYGRVSKVRLSRILVYLVAGAAVASIGTVLVGFGSYAHMLAKVSNYEELRAHSDALESENRTLQADVGRSLRKLDSLESLASEVAVSLGLMRLRETPFGSIESEPHQMNSDQEYRDSLARFRFLRHHATAVKLYASGVPLGRDEDLDRLRYTPSLWPIRGQLVSGFGERDDPFNGEGAFHKGVDIDGEYGDPVRSSADGFVIWAGPRSSFGRLVIVDHGGGIRTYYAHLSSVKAYSGQSVQRGDIVGLVGSTGRAKGTHLHYEVRLNRAPLNPWRFLRTGSAQAPQSRPILSGSSD